MKKIVIITLLAVLGLIFNSCTKKEKIASETTNKIIQVNDKRISLELNAMQKQHQLKNMRNHLEAIQSITMLLSKEKYDIASRIAYEKLGSTTEMKLMCASFGNENFEEMGLDFHKSADKMSEVFKTKDKNKSLEALSITMNYCTQCHATFRQ